MSYFFLGLLDKDPKCYKIFLANSLGYSQNMTVNNIAEDSTYWNQAVTDLEASSLLDIFHSVGRVYPTGEKTFICLPQL